MSNSSAKACGTRAFDASRHFRIVDTDCKGAYSGSACNAGDNFGVVNPDCRSTRSTGPYYARGNFGVVNPDRKGADFARARYACQRLGDGRNQCSDFAVSVNPARDFRVVYAEANNAYRTRAFYASGRRLNGDTAPRAIAPAYLTPTA